MVGKTWGLKPKMMDWMYKSIVRPIFSYTAFIWWPKTETKIGQSTLDKLQRSACLAIIGASRSCPTAAMQVILDLPPLKIFLEKEAAKWAIKISRERDLKPGDLTGYLSILKRCNLPIDMVTGSMPITHKFEINYNIVIPNR